MTKLKHHGASQLKVIHHSKEGKTFSKFIVTSAKSFFCRRCWQSMISWCHKFCSLALLCFKAIFMIHPSESRKLKISLKMFSGSDEVGISWFFTTNVMHHLKTAWRTVGRRHTSLTDAAYISSFSISSNKPLKISSLERAEARVRAELQIAQ